MSDLIGRMRQACEASRKLEHHFAADVLAEAIATVEHLQAAESNAARTRAQGIREAANYLDEEGWNQACVEQGIQAEDYPDELPDAISDWLRDYADEEEKSDERP